MRPISDASRISDSAPIRLNDGVYASRRSPPGRSLPAVEPALGIDLALVGAERRDLVRLEVLELGDADAVLAGDHPAERAREPHDARDRGVRRPQHRVVVGVDRDVGVHVAVTGVHVQRDEHAAAEHAAVDGVEAFDHLAVEDAVEEPLELRAHLLLPRHAQRVVLQQREHRLLNPARGAGGGAARVRPRGARRLAARSRLSARYCQRSRVRATSARALRRPVA